jgi:putative hydrolase of the HAD superfamily
MAAGTVAMTKDIMVPARKNKVVILDLGNVVLDWNVDRVIASIDLDTQESELLKSELFAHQDWLDMDHGKSSESSIVSNVCTRSGLSRKVVEKSILAAKNSLTPIAESLALMKDISDRGIEMHCLSNMSRETYSHIKDHAFFGMFSGIVISGIEGCMKPNEEIFQLTIDRFKLSPAETLFVDDSLPNIVTARRLGINGFHFKRSQRCYTQLQGMLFD